MKTMLVRRMVIQWLTLSAACIGGALLAALPNPDGFGRYAGAPPAVDDEDPTVAAGVASGGGGVGGAGGGGGGSVRSGVSVSVGAGGGGGGIAIAGADAEEPGPGKKVERHVVIKAIEPGKDADFAYAGKESTWLGVATEEAPEILISQLGLANGAGLVVNFVGKDSPAAKAGLQKNDLLVEFEGQSLVVPGQLRKLVQARKEGDQVKLTYYRAGKKETATVTLGKTKGGFDGLGGEGWNWEGPMHNLQLQLQELRDLPIRDSLREHMQGLREHLGNLKLDQRKVQDEIRRNLEEAKRQLERALSEADSASKRGLEPAQKALREIEKSEVLADKNPSVVIRSTGKTAKSVVKSDESGTIVIVANPKPHLTAHDKDGKLLFDGEIDTPDQRDRVPRELWERVEPMLDQMGEKE